MFVNRISELVKHSLQQLASLHSPQAYVNLIITTFIQSYTRLYPINRTLNVMNANGIHLTVSST